MEKEKEMGVEVDERRLVDTEELGVDTQVDAGPSMRSRAHLVWMYYIKYHYLPL